MLKTLGNKKFNYKYYKHIETVPVCCPSTTYQKWCQFFITSHHRIHYVFWKTRIQANSRLKWTRYFWVLFLAIKILAIFIKWWKMNRQIGHSFIFFWQGSLWIRPYPQIYFSLATLRGLDIGCFVPLFHDDSGFRLIHQGSKGLYKQWTDYTINSIWMAILQLGYIYLVY